MSAPAGEEIDTCRTRSSAYVDDRCYPHLEPIEGSTEHLIPLFNARDSRALHLPIFSDRSKTRLLVGVHDAALLVQSCQILACNTELTPLLGFWL